MSVPGLDRQPVPRLAGGRREARVDDDELGAPARSRRAKSCTCVLCMFSPRWEPMSVMQRAFAMSMASGEPTRGAEGELEADLARPAALRVGRRGDVGRAVGLDEVREPASRRSRA